MPAKRQVSQASNRPSKRTKTLFIKIGETNPDDKLNDAQRSVQQPSSSALSTRDTGPTAVPSLVRLSMTRFAQSTVRMTESDLLKSRVYQRLPYIPTHLVQPLFSFLRQYCPERLAPDFIKLFFRGDHIVFSEDMTGVLNRTMYDLREAPDFATGLKSLEIRGQSDLKDTVVAKTISHLPALVNLVLRGCTNVGNKSVEAAAKTCRKLESINLNYTVVRRPALEALFRSCEKLHSVKVAGLSDITDAHSSFLTAASGRLLRLKVRQTRLGPTSSYAISNALGDTALSLDIGFTSLVFSELPKTLEKLSLMATPAPPALLPRLLEPLTKLRKLSLASLGSPTPNLSDDGLKRLIPVLLSCEALVELNLASNTKLGLNGTGGIAALLGALGSRLEVLNLSGIPRLRAYDLEPMMSFAAVPPMRTLLLMNSKLDNAAAPYIAVCQHLQHLNLAGSSFTSEGVGAIVDGCSQLAELDLTGCRGIPIQDRRRFFEAWSTAKRDRSSPLLHD